MPAFGAPSTWTLRSPRRVPDRRFAVNLALSMDAAGCDPSATLTSPDAGMENVTGTSPRYVLIIPFQVPTNVGDGSVTAFGASVAGAGRASCAAYSGSSVAMISSTMDLTEAWPELQSKTAAIPSEGIRRSHAWAASVPPWARTLRKPNRFSSTHHENP